MSFTVSFAFYKISQAEALQSTSDFTGLNQVSIMSTRATLLPYQSTPKGIFLNAKFYEQPATYPVSLKKIITNRYNLQFIHKNYEQLLKNESSNLTKLPTKQRRPDDIVIPCGNLVLDVPETPTSFRDRDLPGECEIESRVPSGTRVIDNGTRFDLAFDKVNKFGPCTVFGLVSDVCADALEFGTGQANWSDLSTPRTVLAKRIAKT